MKNRFLKKLTASAALLGAFALWTVAVCYVDVAPIGPNGSAVGFATLNGRFHHLTGVEMSLYVITDWLGLVPVAVGLGFAVWGLCQWIGRKRILKVDADILVLGVFYIVTVIAYLLFEMVVVNYRPVLIAGRLEASYPSSTTLLTLCVMSTAWLQVRGRMHRGLLRRVLLVAIALFSAFMVAGRLLSGVHWFTDIVGGILLSGGLATLYDAICWPRQK